MTKKEIEFKTYSFLDEYGVPVFSLRLAVSKQTLRNYIEEFKYKYDLKHLNVAHAPEFINYLSFIGIKIDKVEAVEWK